MKPAVPAVNRLLIVFYVLAAGLLIGALLLACTDDAEDGGNTTEPESPTGAASSESAVVDSMNAGSGTDGNSSGAGVNESAGDSSAPAPGKKTGRTETIGKPGTQSHTVVSGKSRGESGRSGQTDGGSNKPGIRAGKPGTQASGIASSRAPANTGATAGEVAALPDDKSATPSGSTESGAHSRTQAGDAGGIVAPENPNRALAGITPVPGYVRITDSPQNAGSRITVETAPEVIPGSSGNSGLPVPALELELAPVKTFRFTWTDIAGETEYRLLEKTGSNYRQLAALPADTVAHDLKVFLPRRVNARYVLQACNDAGCASSAAVRVGGSLAEAVGYLKASNTGSGDRFGHALAISGDGNTLAVGAPSEDGAAAGINGEQNSNSASTSGAVYVFARKGGAWIQQAYLKSSSPRTGEEFGYALALSDNGATLAVGAGRENSNLDRIKGDADLTQPSGGVYIFVRKGGLWNQQLYMKPSNLADKNAADTFGVSVALSGDGGILAVGADGEGSDATGVNGDQDNEQAKGSGAVYVFARNGGDWVQQVYVKASNTEPGDHFGRSVSLSNDGATLAVGAVGEDSAASGINGDQQDNTAVGSGAVYVYIRSGGNWAQQAYVKASNNRPGGLVTGDAFGGSVALSGDGRTLAVGARFEDATVTGINGNQHAGSNHSSGAVYIFTRSGGDWTQQAYVKASNTGWGDEFGSAVALSGNGNTLAVGAPFEDSGAAGINGDEDNDMLKSPGAAYVFARNGKRWVQRAYVKASNTMLVPRDPEHAFGFAVALADSGDLLAVSAPGEDSAATGVNGGQRDTYAGASGAVYLY